MQAVILQPMINQMRGMLKGGSRRWEVKKKMLGAKLQSLKRTSPPKPMSEIVQLGIKSKILA